MKFLEVLLFLTFFITFVIETIINAFDNREFIIFFQTSLSLFTVIAYFSLNKFSFQKSLVSYVASLSLLLLFLGLFSSNPIRTYNFILKFIVPIFYIFLGYNFLTKKSELFQFVSKLWILLLYFLFYILLSNILGFGESLYDGAIISVGYMNVNSSYVPVILILIILYLNKHVSGRFNKKLNVITAICVSLIIVLMLKRTLILIMVLGFVFYLMRNFNFYKSLKYSAIFSIIFLLIFPSFLTYFKGSLEARGSRFSQDYSILDEGRFIENIVVYDYLVESPKYILFGTGEVFNDSVYMYKYFGIDRNLHNSFIRIIWSSGLIGFFLFVFFYYKQFSLIRTGIGSIRYVDDFGDVIYFGLIFVLIRFINEFSSGITYLSYNMISYFILGSIIAISNGRQNFHNRYITNF